DLQLRPPRRLVPEGDYAKELWIRVSPESRAAWDAIHADLTSKATLATFVRVRDAFARTTARHELQHRLDAQKTPCREATVCAALHVPDRVRERMGPPGDEPVRLGSLPARVSEESSAYLAELCDGDLSPRITIA